MTKPIIHHNCPRISQENIYTFYLKYMHASRNGSMVWTSCNLVYSMDILAYYFYKPWLLVLGKKGYIYFVPYNQA